MSLLKIPLWQALTAVIVLAFVVAGGWYYYQASNRIIWSMIELDGAPGSGDAHLLEFPSGYVVLIDTGSGQSTRRNVMPYLDQRGVDHLDQLIITRGHQDSRTAIETLLRHLNYIHEVYYNLPSKSQCEPGSSRCESMLKTRALIESFGASVRQLTTDGLLYHSNDHDVILEVVYNNDNAGSEPTNIERGNVGAMLRLIYGTTTVLFTGAVNRQVGDHLLAEHYFLDSTIMTAPRRSAGIGASDEFLRNVDAQAILASNSADDWRQRQREPVREFAYNNDVPTYVTGLHGNVVVTLKRDSFTVHTQR